MSADVRYRISLGLRRGQRMDSVQRTSSQFDPEPTIGSFRLTQQVPSREVDGAWFERNSVRIQNLLRAHAIKVEVLTEQGAVPVTLDTVRRMELAARPKWVGLEIMAEVFQDAPPLFLPEPLPEAVPAPAPAPAPVAAHPFEAREPEKVAPPPPQDDDIPPPPVSVQRVPTREEPPGLPKGPRQVQSQQHGGKHKK